MRKDNQILFDKSTEEKIKITAEKLFIEKGFSGTRTRDIAEAANINLALLNYYFRSKENLFNVIMREKLNAFFNDMISVLTSVESFEDKVKLFSQRYIDLLVKDSSIVVFSISEMQKNPDFFTRQLNIRGRLEKAKTGFLYDRFVENDEKSIQLLLSFVSMIFFPFIMKGALTTVMDISEQKFNDLMLKRKELLPLWVNSFLQQLA